MCGESYEYIVKWTSFQRQVRLNHRHSLFLMVDSPLGTKAILTKSQKAMCENLGESHPQVGFKHCCSNLGLNKSYACFCSMVLKEHYCSFWFCLNLLSHLGHPRSIWVFNCGFAFSAVGLALCGQLGACLRRERAEQTGTAKRPKLEEEPFELL